LSRRESAGECSQTVAQADELPRRELSVIKDYQVLLGTIA
jgi:hypothetical protein